MNFTKIQLVFIHELTKCHNLYEEMSTMKPKYLTDAVIHDNLRCEAYLVWRNHQLEVQKQNEEFMNEQKNSNKVNHDSKPGSFSFEMKKPVKKN
jgi:hypothetical protein